jgi:hypothetical protein
MGESVSRGGVNSVRRNTEGFGRKAGEHDDNENRDKEHFSRVDNKKGQFKQFI